MSAFTTIVRSHMRALRMDEAELARQVGVSKSTVMRWLDGSVPDFEHVIKLCVALRITPADVADALFPEQMQDLRKVLPTRAELSDRIAKATARADIVDRLMQEDDETLKAIWVLLERKGV